MSIEDISLGKLNKSVFWGPLVINSNTDLVNDCYVYKRYDHSLYIAIPSPTDFIYMGELNQVTLESFLNNDLYNASPIHMSLLDSYPLSELGESDNYIAYKFKNNPSDIIIFKKVAPAVLCYQDLSPYHIQEFLDKRINLF